MAKGGARPGAGRKKKAKIPDFVTRDIAKQVLALTQPPIHGTKDKCLCEICKWYRLLHVSNDARLEFDVLKYLTDRAYGKAVQNVNHIHDKPIEMNVNVSMSEVVRKVRERKQEYERTRSH
jgi:hypothetical protein